MTFCAKYFKSHIVQRRIRLAAHFSLIMKFKLVFIWKFCSQMKYGRKIRTMPTEERNKNECLKHWQTYISVTNCRTDLLCLSEQYLYRLNEVSLIILFSVVFIKCMYFVLVHTNLRYLCPFLCCCCVGFFFFFMV